MLSSLQAGNVTPKCPSTDIFDMIPFSPVSHQSSIPTRNGTQPPPVPSRSTEISKLSKQINILCYICVHFKCLISTLWEIIYLHKLTKNFNHRRIMFIYMCQIQLFIFYLIIESILLKTSLFAFETILWKMIFWYRVSYLRIQNNYAYCVGVIFLMIKNSPVVIILIILTHHLELSLNFFLS